MSTNTIAGFRLSQQQERVWTLSQTRPAVHPHASCVVSIEGPLDLGRLKDCAGELVAHHEILHTVFQRQAGFKTPFQVIRDSGSVNWEEFDLTSISEASQQERIETLFRGLPLRGFDLEHGPVLRIAVATLAKNRYVLILSLPALCGDARSLQNAIAELSALYSGSESADAMQYADYGEWQHDLLSGDDAKAGQQFWREYGRKLNLDAHPLPLEQKSAEREGFDCVAVRLDNPLTPQQVDSAGGPAEIGKFVLACWSALLSRLTGQTDLTVCCELSGRKYEDLESALGPFSRNLPLAATVNAAEPFALLLHKIKQTAADLHNWQDSFSWTYLDNGDAGLQYGFEYAVLPPKQVSGDLRWQIVRQQVVSEPFKLRLSAVRSEDALTLEFHYDTSRLSRAAVERIAQYFQSLLAAAVAAPQTPVSRLPLLSDAERTEILYDWNQTSADYPQCCFHQMFEAQAARTPDRPALRFNDRVLSYRELNEQANQLAHYLQRQGVGPDSLVGLCVERSAEMMVALLAILKAGGVYVPLNPDNPKPRLAQQLAGAVVLITEQKLAAQMPEFSGTTLCLDRDHQLWASDPAANPQLTTTPDNLVYVIYTSGSTGVPKGVAVRHRNLVNYTQFITRLLKLETYPNGLNFATVSTIGADLGNTCIYPALASGGCLHMISYEVSTDAQRFADYCGRYPVDVLKIVPSHLSALLHSADAKSLLPRKFLITGGEALTAQLVDSVEQLGTSCEIINHYGPTETTVGSLTLPLKDYEWKRSSTVPIGRPIANTQVYILDAEHQPVPAGVVGELYVAGAGVTAGYLNQPERTAERFLPNPFVNDPAAKMYRTGDLARHDDQGRVEFLGRGDDQVKIRGFRIELGEVEAVLAKHAAVKQAVVLAKEDEGGEKRLIAYVVAHREHTISADELKTYLQQQLPDYMVPSAIVALAKIPLTANGKIDRQALPAPEQVAAKVYVAPRNETEQTIAKVWAEVLRRERISVDDNFFDLGGHSLMATQVVSRLRRALNIDLPLRTLFESPTVAKLAEHLAHSSKPQQSPVAPPITRTSRSGPLPLSFAQQRLWVLDQFQPNNPLYNIPRAVRMKGNLNVDALTRALNEIISRHESQRTTFTVVNGEPAQVIAPALTLSVPVHDLSSLPAEQREAEAHRIAATEAQQPFDLSQGPLLRAVLVRLAPDDHVLLLTMHHIVSDAWSAGVFVSEMSDLYEAFISGKSSPLPDLPVQYADYAVWQRNWLQGDVLQDQLKYWREQLKGAPAVIELPADRPRPAAQSFEGRYETVPLSEEVSRAVKDFSQQHGVTAFMTLLASFEALLSRYSGQEQIVAGTDFANRPTPETEKLIGFFINVLPLRLDLSGNPTFTEMARRVREVTLGAYAHQDMPFDKLVEELQPQRNLSYNPLIQVLFVMQNIPRQRRELAGLKLEPFAMPITRSKFDLAVFMVEEGQRLVSNWLYSTDLFDSQTIQRIATHYEKFLCNAIAAPETRLSAIEIFSEAEKQQRAEEKKQRKQSQLKKLMAVEPKAFSVGSGDSNQ